MTELLLILTFVSASVWTFHRARKIDVSSLRFEDGILIGLIFYIICPGFFILFLGEVRNYDLNATPFRPFEDLTTSLNILIGWISVLLFHTMRTNSASANAIKTGSDGLNLILFLVLYASLTLISFIVSGRAEGGHWQERIGRGFADSSSLILIANFANVLRTAVFGYILFVAELKLLRPFQAVLCGAMVVAFDFALTFNRITAVYFIVFLLLLYRRHFWLVAGAFVLSAPLVGYLSSVWSVLRAYALRNGYSVEGLISAATIAANSQSDEQPFDKLLNSLFESSNIIVFNHIVSHINEGFPILWGQTFLGRSLTFLVPSTFWPDKPKVFGTILGDYIQSTGTLALNSTLFGEALANFYYLWPVALLMALIVIAEAFRHLSKRLLTSAGFLGCFIGVALWRFDLAFAFISLFTLLIFSLGAAVFRGLFGLNHLSPQFPQHRRLKVVRNDRSIK